MGEDEIRVTEWIERAIRRYEKNGEDAEAKDGELVLKIVEQSYKGRRAGVKKWFNIKNKDGLDITFMTDALVYFYYHKGRNTTIIRTVNGDHEFPGDQTYNIEVAIGELSGQN